jgi:Uncharacterized conserved protein
MERNIEETDNKVNTKSQNQNKEGFFGRLKTSIKDNFIVGLIFSGPILGTLYILFLLFSFFDRIFGQIYYKILGFNIPGAGLITLFVFIVLLGVFARTYFANFFLGAFERVVKKIPLVSSIYSTLKSVSDIFQKKRSLGRPVFVFFGQGYIPAFEISSDDKIASVIIPSTPNPTTGFVFLFPKKNLIYANISAEEFMKFFLSLGMYMLKVDLDELERMRLRASEGNSLEQKN